MTYPPTAARTSVCAALLALFSGCGFDSSNGVFMLLVSPEPSAQLTLLADDTDPEVAGLQLDIKGRSDGISQGTAVNLLIDDREQEVSGRVDVRGDVLLSGVTLPPGLHTIYLETSTGSASSNKEQQYTLKALLVESPDNGATLGTSEDEDGSQDGVQISARVSTFAFELSEEVTLLLDGDVLDTKTPDDHGEIVYSGITLSNGRHRIKAVSGGGEDAIESDEVGVQVRESCAAVTFVEPAPPPPGETSVSLGGVDCPDPRGGDPFVTRVVISTDAGDGRPVTLLLDGTPLASTAVDGATAVFEGVPLTHFNSDNQLSVDVQNSEGANCIVNFPGELLVDCAGPDCTLASPTPVSYVDDTAQLTLFLNAALQGEDGFEVVVESGTDLDGLDVQLIVDGDTRRALYAPAQADGGGTSAAFVVDLDEGEHTLEALCADGASNVTSSGVVAWTVDVSACEVSITDPIEDTQFLPADDEDAASPGTQVIVSGSVTGDNCARQRSALCQVADGIAGTDFVAFDGISPLLAPVTLDGAADAQTLCIEIEDRAGNIGLGAVNVRYRANAPMLVIEAPGDGDAFNALGNDGHVADADATGSPTVCDAEFQVACSELGAPVELRHDGASGAVFASALCEAPQAADPALPAGFAGRATLVAPFGDGGTWTGVVATQRVPSGLTELIGASAPIVIAGDCGAPQLSFQNDPCDVAGDNQLTLAEAVARDVIVLDATSGVASATLAFVNAGPGAETGTVAASATTSASATFDDVNLGGAGAVTLEVTVLDAFANSAELTCNATIVP